MSRTIASSPLKTDVRLTRLQPDHAEFLRDVMLSPGYLEQVGDRGVRTVEQAHAYIESYFLPQYREFGLGYYVIENGKGEPVGVVGLMKRDFLDHPDLGFAILPQHYRQGFTLNACQQLLDLARNELGLRTVEAFTSQTNTASQCLLAKLGFQNLGQIIHPESRETLMRYALRL